MDLKELEKLLKVCRKQGVTDISFDGAQVKFGDLPVSKEPVEYVEEVPTDELSPDELLYYHIQGGK